MFLTDGLIALWKFENNANDSIGNNNGTPSGTSYTTGKIGTGINFTASSNYINLSYPILGSIITIAGWYYYGGVGTDSGWNTLFCRNGGTYHHILIQDSDRVLGFYNSGWYPSSQVLTVGNWYFIVAEKVGTNQKIYVNNSLVLDSNSSFDNNSVGGFGIIGNYVAGQQQGTIGVVDEVAVWNRVLDSTEKTTLYNGGNGLDYPYNLSPFPKKYKRSRILRQDNNAEGGIVTMDGNYMVHTFLSDGYFTPKGSGLVDILVVAGGGGGGMDMGGGGGGGGVIYQQNYSVSANTPIRVSIGAGGIGAPAAGVSGQPTGHQYTVSATNGGNSVFGTLTAIGGGYGGSSYFAYTPNNGYGNSGGSGGGASGYSDGNTGRGGSGTSGQGYAGGGSSGQYYSGGGGGAGGVGTGGGSQPNGGAGFQCSINGTALYWGGGGGGSAYSAGNGGNGGNGGGGGGAVGTSTGGAGLNNGEAGGGGTNNAQTNRRGGDGGANTGGGGGGGSHYNANNKGGDGGSGIVIVRYLVNSLI